MGIQFDDLIRNARLDAIETNVGTSPLLKLRTGSKPANVAAADTGTVLASMTLPSDWMAAASAGAKALLGLWQDLLGDAAGDAGHFRIYTSGGTAKIQGSVTATGGGGDLTLDNINIAVNQAVSVTSFVLTDGNS